MSTVDPSPTADLERRLQRVQRDLEYRLDSVEETASRLKRDLEELEDTPHRLESIEYDVQAAKRETRRVERDLEETVEGVERDVSRTRDRITALERYLRQADGAVIADLDTPADSDLHALVSTVAKGLTAREGLLSPQQRAQLQYARSQLQQTLEARREHRAEALAAAHIVASTQAGGPQRVKAEETFAVSAAKAQEAAGLLPERREAAAAAEKQLDDDDRLRGQRAKTIAAGERADTKLRLALRSRLAEALAGGALLPVWFVTVLGPTPPGSGTAEWMETATDLLAYRTTYKVTDQAVALGPDTAFVSSRRRQWHRRLAAEFDERNS